MNIGRWMTGAVAGGLACAAGCASAPKDAGFASVRQTVEQRTGEPIEWRGRTTADRAADAAVDAILSQPINADEAVQVALLNNRSLAATFEELGIAQADLVQAGLLQNPVFSLSVRFPDRSPGRTYLDFSAAEDFLDVFLVSARKKIAQAQFDAAVARVTHELLKLAAETRIAFYQYQAAEQTMALRRTDAQAAAAALDAARRLHDAGNTTDLDYLMQQAQEARTKVDLAAAEGDLADARERVNALMGIDGQQLSWQARGRLPALPTSDPAPAGLEDWAIQQREDLAAVRQQELMQARMLGLTKQTRLFNGTTIGPEAERETDGQWRIGPTVQVPLPIFDQGQAAVARGRAMLIQDRRRYEALAADVRSQVRLAERRMSNARLRAEYYRDHVLPVQRQLVHQTQLEYNAMLAGVFRLLQARRDEIDAEREYIEALRDYWVARTQLEQAVGGKLPRGPRPTTEPTTCPISQPAQTQPSTGSGHESS